MIRRIVTAVFVLSAVGISALNAEVLRCKVKATAHGFQQRTVDIVLPPEIDAHQFDLSLMDRLTGRLRLLGQGDLPIIGRPQVRGLGFIEVRTVLSDGTYGKPQRHDLVVSLPLKGFDLMGIYFRDGIAAAFTGTLFVRLTGGSKKITLADATHMPGTLTLYEGECE